jgi:hypothetical protein
MQLYRSSSFGRRERRSRRPSAGHEFYWAHANAAAPVPQAAHHAPAVHAPAAAAHVVAAARAPRAAKPTINFRDTEEGTDTIMMTNEPVRTHLAANKNDNITLLWAAGGGYRAANTRRSDFTRPGNNIYVYECRPETAGNLVVYGMQHVHPGRFINMTKAGIEIGGFLDASKPFLAKHQVYLLHPTRVLNKIADYAIVNGGYQGQHCQEGTGGQAYELRPVKLKKGGAAAFGRRRRRSSSFGRRRRRSSSFGRRRRR